MRTAHTRVILRNRKGALALRPLARACDLRPALAPGVLLSQATSPGAPLLLRSINMEWLRRLEAENDHVHRLKTDLPYFAETSLKLRPKIGSIAPFVFNPAQLRLHEIIEAQKAKTGRVRVIVLKARQLGISSYVAARFYCKTINSPGLRRLEQSIPDCETLS